MPTLELKNFKLGSGLHNPPPGGEPPAPFDACVMEAVAYIAGERWSDNPECVCPVIASFCRRWNDALDNDTRQILVPLIPVLVGTRSRKAVEHRRSWMCVDWLIRVFTPTWLRQAEGCAVYADQIEAFAEITNPDHLAAILPLLKGAQKVSEAAESAARSVAWSAVRSAAWSAARSAAWSAAWSAVRSVAESAARSVAWSAAESAVRSAAWSVAESALQPTVETLQKSALDLIRRMCAVTEE